MSTLPGLRTQNLVSSRAWHLEVPWLGELLRMECRSLGSQVQEGPPLCGLEKQRNMTASTPSLVIQSLVCCSACIDMSKHPLATSEMSQPCCKDRKCLLPEGVMVPWRALSFFEKEFQRRAHRYPYAVTEDTIYFSCFCHRDEPHPDLGHPGDVYVGIGAGQGRLFAKVGDQEWKEWTSMNINLWDKEVIYHPLFPKRRFLFIHPEQREVVWTTSDTARRWKHKYPGFNFQTALMQLVHEYRPKLQGQGSNPNESQLCSIMMIPGPVHLTAYPTCDPEIIERVPAPTYIWSRVKPDNSLVSFPSPPGGLVPLLCQSEPSHSPRLDPSQHGSGVPADNTTIPPDPATHRTGHLALMAHSHTIPGAAECYFTTSGNSSDAESSDASSATVEEVLESSEDDGGHIIRGFKQSYCRSEPYPKREVV
ncbi:hypothetical protein OE88DRAFT_1640291 [Heliocybe sulcata]|uniref:Uncharacterized protein n=1 Tax=Heliocybe sulcata TaxID=5364 RepID=A0A5C3NRI0_9AGAM|nr:hypothetical protein OE88DRAFT_1640291 [Heliocybe sulcata]